MTTAGMADVSDTLLAIAALVSPGGRGFDINQFLSEDDPALDEFLNNYKINISSLPVQ